jgi:uncharacterized repeat protein (TIGR01451 family)
MKTATRYLRLLCLLGLILTQAARPAPASARTSTAASMPAGLYQAMLDSTQTKTAFRANGGFSIQSNGLRADLEAAGLSLAPQNGPGWSWGTTLTAFGRGPNPAAAHSSGVSSQDGQVTYDYSGFSEWYRETGFGLEQGFTVQQSPQGNGKLVLHLRLDTSLDGSLSADGRSLSFDAGNGETLNYSNLQAFDANGAELDARLIYTPSQIVIQIDDREAAYPLTIDPLIFLETKRLALDGGAGDYFGGSVAISGDTAIVGAYGDNSNQGSAYIFVHSGGVWSQRAKLTASDGAAFDYFGYSVAISGDTAIVGAYGDNSNQGSAYIFVKPGGGWATGNQTAKLTASDGVGGDVFGWSVAISGDTAIVGAYNDDSSRGSAYVFVKPGGGWVTGNQTAKLTASDGVVPDQFGYSVTLSGDTAVVGARSDNSNQGSAYVFVKPGGGWATGTETAKLTASDGAGSDNFGSSVAISGDTAVVGAYYDNSQQGSAYFYFPYRTDADLAVNAVASKSNPLPGDAITLTASVTNFGPSTASSLLLSSPLPAGFTFVGAVPTQGSYDSSTGSWDVGTLNFGVTATLDIQATVDMGAGGTHPVFTAGLIGWDTNNANNSASVNLQVPSLSFSPDPLSFGNQLINTTSLAKTVTVTNVSDETVKLGTLKVPLGFILSSNLCTNVTLESYAACTFKVQFKPTTTVTYTGNISLQSLIPTDTFMLPVSGNGARVTQLLLNRSFETDVNADKVPDGWASGGAWALADGRDCTVHKYGLCSLKFTGTSALKQLSFTVLRNGVSGDKLAFGVWERAASVPIGATFDGHVDIYNGVTLLTTKTISLTTGTYIYKIVSLAFTAPGAYTKLVVTFEYNAASGTVWFDNASLTWTP